MRCTNNIDMGIPRNGQQHTNLNPPKAPHKVRMTRHNITEQDCNNYRMNMTQRSFNRNTALESPTSKTVDGI